jgi:hypothetical protein
LEYIEKENIQDLKQKTAFPAYKDLEPYKQYKIETMRELHGVIISLLNRIYNHVLTKEIEFKKYKEKQDMGFNMQNFLSTFSDTVLTIRQKHDLFTSYTCFFHSMHLKYLKRLLTKICLFESQMNNDIKFDFIENIGIENKTQIDLSENVVVVKHENESNKKTTIRSVFQRNVKKFINGMRLFGRSRDENEIKDEILTLHSSSSEMEELAKSIKSEIVELKSSVDDSVTKMKSQEQSIPLPKPSQDY